MQSPPVILLGGMDSTLAILRSLTEKNIPVVVCAGEECPALRSRYCKRFFVTPSAPDEKAPFWADLLLGDNHSELRGSVLFACGDREVEFLAHHRRELEQSYILDDFVPSIHLAMQDKQQTLQLAKSAGIPVPRSWKVRTVEAVELIRSELTFPAVIKPIESHAAFDRIYSRKLFVVDSYHQLVQTMADIERHGIEIMVCDLIPGLDSEVTSSYYTYIDAAGNQLFRFTKRVLRRYPVSGGNGAFHITQWLPETAAMGERFFRGIGFRGLGNVEFKRDPRDGLLKLIECNARFTDSHELLVRCGMDTAYIIYCKLTNRPLPPVDSYQQELGLWYPWRDLKAFLELRSRRELGLAQWARSLARKQTLPYFRMSDPWPSISRAVDAVRARSRTVITSFIKSPIHNGARWSRLEKSSGTAMKAPAE
jgi:D-aspartate ligase